MTEQTHIFAKNVPYAGNRGERESVNGRCRAWRGGGFWILIACSLFVLSRKAPGHHVARWFFRGSD